MASRASTPIYRVAAIILSLVWGYLGIKGWWNQWSRCTNAGLIIQTIAQLLYGTISVAAVIILLRERKLPKILEWSWAITMAVAAGMAPVVWGGAGIGAGIASGIAGILLGLGMIWLARRGSQS